MDAVKIKQKRVVVAMSGGVDSSVAAALLKEQRYEVIGMTMNVYELPKDICRSENLMSCCGWQAVEDAHRVAHLLGISHYVVDLKADFEEKVIKDFCDQYARGKTPNPCIRCNEFIKFDALMKRTHKLNADFLATGHHARIEYDPRIKRYLLKKGKDKQKDQSYFLYLMTQEQLSRTLMPIGFFTKDEVRKKAHELGLPVAQRVESQEVCFVPDDDYAGFLRSRTPKAFRPGPIVNSENKVLGQHKGIAHYTIGQRRGMGIAAPHPLYVLEVMPQKNTIVVGTNDELYHKKLIASHVHLNSGEGLKEPIPVKARIRYKHREAKAILSPLDSGNALVAFFRAQRAITPGQSVVFYDKDVVLGGAIIEKSL